MLRKNIWVQIYSNLCDVATFLRYSALSHKFIATDPIKEKWSLLQQQQQSPGHHTNIMTNCYIFLTVCLTMAASASAFLSPSSAHQTTSKLLMAMDAPPAILAESISSVKSFDITSSLSNGINAYLSEDSSILTSSQVVSLKDRPPPPTPEEIAAKKRTFNLWFWGGGFVAPFLATFYYFGFKFWER